MKIYKSLLVLLFIVFVYGCGNFFTSEFPKGSYVKIKLTGQKGMVILCQPGGGYNIRVAEMVNANGSTESVSPCVRFFRAVELEKWNNGGKEVL